MLDIQSKGNQIFINGEVDIATAEGFEKAVKDLVDAQEKVIEIDMQQMDYIDSTGLGILMDINKNRLADGQKIVLVKPKRSIQKLMQLTGVDKIFEIVK